MGMDLSVPDGVLTPWPDAALQEDARKRFKALIRQLEQGNDGQPWCRFAVDSVRTHRFLVADVRSRFEEDGLALAIEWLAELFDKCVPFKGIEASRPDTLTALLDDAPHSIEGAVHEKRGWLLQRGLVMTALHPKSNLRPLGHAVDRSARPYQSDATFLSIRWAVPADRVFTRKNSDLTALLDSWLRRCEPCRE